MIQITATIVGAEQVQAWLGGSGTKAHAALKEEVDRLGMKLLRRVKANRLTGQSLKVQTGRLRRSINYRFEETGDTMKGSVGTNVVYGAFWELGPKKTIVSVRAHVRRMEARSTYLLKKAGAKAGKLAAQGVQFVSAHQRTVKVQARPFLKPELDSMRAEIKQRLTAAALGGIRGR